MSCESDGVTDPNVLNHLLRAISDGDYLECWVNRVRQLGLDPYGALDQVRRLRDRVAELESERDAKHDALQRENAELKEQLTACADAWWAGKKMSVEASQAIADWRAKYEALLAVARVPPSVLDYANGCRGLGTTSFDVGDFIRRLADATKPEPPERKTRFQAALDHYIPIYGVCDEDMLREGLVAAGVDPDEELPEVAK